MASQELRRQISEAINSILAFENRVPELISRPEWGTFTFSEAKPHIEFLIWFANHVRNFSFEIIPDDIAQNALNLMNTAAGQLQTLNGFRIGRGDPVDFRDSICPSIRNNTSKFADCMGNWTPILFTQLSESQDEFFQMKELKSKMENLLSESEGYFSQKKEEVDNAVQAARNAAGEAGAAEFTAAFEKEAEDQEEQAWRWVGATVAIGCLLILFPLSVIIGLATGPPSNSTLWDAISYFGNRLLAFSVLFYATTRTGRMALACFNLASVNKHRALSLQTLQAFHAAAADRAAKDAVVMEAARAVYEPVSTGFLGKTESAIKQSVLSRLVDVVRGRGGSE